LNAGVCGDNRQAIHALSSTAPVTCPFESCSAYKQIMGVLMDCTFPV